MNELISTAISRPSLPRICKRPVSQNGRAHLPPRRSPSLPPLSLSHSLSFMEHAHTRVREKRREAGCSSSAETDCRRRERQWLGDRRESGRGARAKRAIGTRAPPSERNLAGTMEHRIFNAPLDDAEGRGAKQWRFLASDSRSSISMIFYPFQIETGAIVAEIRARGEARGLFQAAGSGIRQGRVRVLPSNSRRYNARSNAEIRGASEKISRDARRLRASDSH
jgi:hypothetical protein